MTTTPIVILDTETDGVHPGRKVWEVAMIRRDDTGQRERTFYFEIDLSTADPFGLKIGRFYERHPYGLYLAELGRPEPGLGSHYLSSSSAAHCVAQWTYGAHIVGAVPNFDTEVLAALLRAHELTPAWHYHLTDVEGLAVGYLAAGADAETEEGQAAARELSRQRPWDSEAISRACGVEPPPEDERHTALGDARWAMRLYDAILGASDA